MYLARFLSGFSIYGHGVLLVGFGIFIGILLVVLYVAYVKK